MVSTWSQHEVKQRLEPRVDILLALQPGGKTVITGEGGEVMRGYVMRTIGSHMTHHSDHNASPGTKQYNVHTGPARLRLQSDRKCLKTNSAESGDALRWHNGSDDVNTVLGLLSSACCEDNLETPAGGEQSAVSVVIRSTPDLRHDTPMIKSNLFKTQSFSYYVKVCIYCCPGSEAGLNSP